MPAKVDSISGRSVERDSTFSYEQTAPVNNNHLDERDRLIAARLYHSTERIRTESVDSGMGVTTQATDINMSMKKVSPFFFFCTKPRH